MDKFKLLKKIVDSLTYSHTKDTLDDISILLKELVCEDYIIITNGTCKPTKMGMKVVRYKSIQDYELSMNQDKTIINKNIHNGGIVKHIMKIS